MQRAGAIVDERRTLASIYDDAFSDLDWLQTPVTPSDYCHGYRVTHVCLSLSK